MRKLYSLFLLLLLPLVSLGQSAGDLVITEIMQNPSAVGDTEGEWFEIFNTTDAAIDIDGWEIRDKDGEAHTIAGTVSVPAKGFALLCRNSDSSTNGGVACAYQYSDFFLGNSSDEVVLATAGNVQIDSVAYDGGPNFPDPNGASMVYTGAADGDNNDSSLWAEATSREDNYTGTEGDLGSPGAEGNQQSLTSAPDAVVAFDGEDVEVNEFDGSVTLTLRLNNADGNEISVDVLFAADSSSAEAATDLDNYMTQTVTFDASAMSGDTETVTVNLTDDAEDEAYETAVFKLVNLTSTGSAVIGADSLYTVGIIDDEDAFDVDMLMVVEIMQNPDAVGDSEGEWFEVYNATDAAIDLDGWQFLGGGENIEFIIDESIVIPADSFAVLCKMTDDTMNGGFTCDYAFGDDYGLSNGDDQIILRSPSGNEIDRVAWDNGDTFPDPTGASMVYTGTAEEDNNNGASWAEAALREDSYTGDTGDLGSPGTAGAQQNLMGDPNEAPTAAMILAPEDGASIQIDGSGTQEVDVEWTSATDADDDTVFYLWELSTTEDFGEDIVVEEETGADTTLSAAYIDVDGLLEELGVAVGDSTTLYHRVLASDGVDTTASDTFSVTFVRGEVMLTIAEARSLGAGSDVRVMGIVTRAMGDFVRIQDETGGLTIRQTEGDFFNDVANGDIAWGDSIYVEGELSEFASLLQINDDDLEDYEVLGEAVFVPLPIPLTLEEIAEDGELYESMLIVVSNLHIDTDDETFAPSTTYDIADGTTDFEVVDLRTPNGDDSEIDGTEVPEGAFVFEGVLSQFDFDDPTVGYQLQPVWADDVRELDFAEARRIGSGNVVGLTGIVTRAMGDFVRLQGETGGLTIRQTEGDFFDAVAGGTLAPGDSLYVEGTLSEFASLLQINEGDLDTFWVVSSGNPLPAPISLTLAEIAEDGEIYESMLVRVDDLTISTTDVTFQERFTYNISDPTLSDNSVSLRTPNADDSEVDGTTVPTGVFAFRGVLSQFDFDDPEVGYQLQPVDEEDIILDPSSTEGLSLPASFALHGNYPNPFNPVTTLRFDLPAAAEVRISVYDVLGREVLTVEAGQQAAGFGRTFQVDASMLASGLYLYRVVARTKTGVLTSTGQMTLLK